MEYGIEELKKWEPFLESLAQLLNRSQSIKTVLSILPQKQRRALTPLLPQTIEALEISVKKLDDFLAEARQSSTKTEPEISVH